MFIKLVGDQRTAGPLSYLWLGGNERTGYIGFTV